MHGRGRAVFCHECKSCSPDSSRNRSLVLLKFCVASASALTPQFCPVHVVGYSEPVSACRVVAQYRVALIILRAGRSECHFASFGGRAWEGFSLACKFWLCYWHCVHSMRSVALFCGDTTRRFGWISDTTSDAAFLVAINHVLVARVCCANLGR